MVPVDDTLLKVAWDNDFIVQRVNNDIAKCFCSDSAFVTRAGDVALDLVVTILL